MSDLRDPEPAHRTLDMRAFTTGSEVVQIDMDVWPYSGLRAEKVYARKVTFIIRSDSARAAVGSGCMLAATVEAAHDVWKTRITRIEVVST